jgi:hypothetical protein
MFFALFGFRFVRGAEGGVCLKEKGAATDAASEEQAKGGGEQGCEQVGEAAVNEADVNDADVNEADWLQSGHYPPWLCGERAGAEHELKSAVRGNAFWDARKCAHTQSWGCLCA